MLVALLMLSDKARNSSPNPKAEAINKVRKPKNSSDDTRISRLITACTRCRQKKVKCDRKFPMCTNCDKSGAECACLDPATGEQVSRFRIHDLETRLQQVTDELNALKRDKPKQPMFARTNNEFRFGKVILMKDNEIGETFRSDGTEIEIPARSFVEVCLQSYFTLSNVQIPILHRDYYLFNYFKPLYGHIGRDLWLKILGSNFAAPNFGETEEEANPDAFHKGRCLFFLYIIIAILTSQHQQKYPLMISNHYKKQAFRYVDCVWKSVERPGGDELSKLEMLQSLLLLTQYSLMRPCTPGAWYLVGTCVKLCQDLGLHHEPMYLHSDDYYIVDMRRRLFWCCYSLDRQISIYFGRPFGIDSRQIDCPLLSTRDDLFLKHSPTQDYDVSKWLCEEPHSKLVSIHFINLRVLQGEILDFINDTAHRVPSQRFQKFDDPLFQAKIHRHDQWKRQKHADLLQWFDEVPSKSDVYRLFNEMIFKLNLNQTLISLYGFSAITPVVNQLQHHRILFDAGREIIRTYVKLVAMKMMNFSWVAINNLFTGATVYLSLILLAKEIREKILLSELKLDCAGAVLVFDELCKICYEPAKDYTEKFKVHSAAVIETCEKEIIRGNNYAPQSMRKAVSERSTFSSMGSSVAPATLVAPVPQRSSSMQQNHPDEGEGFNEFMGSDHDVFLNNMMGSINATYQGLDPSDFGLIDIHENPSLDPEFHS